MPNFCSGVHLIQITTVHVSDSPHLEIHVFFHCFCISKSTNLWLNFKTFYLCSKSDFRVLDQNCLHVRISFIIITHYHTFSLIQFYHYLVSVLHFILGKSLAKNWRKPFWMLMRKPEAKFWSTASAGLSVFSNPRMPHTPRLPKKFWTNSWIQPCLCFRQTIHAYQILKIIHNVVLVLSQVYSLIHFFCKKKVYKQFFVLHFKKLDKWGLIMVYQILEYLVFGMKATNRWVKEGM